MPNIWADPEPTFGSRRPYKQLTVYLLLFVANKTLQPHSLLIIAVGNLKRFSGRCFVTAYELIIILNVD